MTKNGAIILNILKQAQAFGQHLTAEEVYLLAKQEAPGMVMATVYNNLNSLAAEGLLRRVHRSEGPDYFDGNTVYHDHLVCDRCGKIVDVTLKDFLTDLEQRTGVAITGYDLNIRYVCDECKEKDISDNL